jgi:hypothetical protein
VSATTCGAPISGDGSAQTIALKPVLLVNGVSYVPAIVRSATVGTRVQFSLEYACIVVANISSCWLISLLED